ncbi:putative glycosyltransferase [Cucumis melo var. makuwa]|uniref:Glycosyltransferase n=1 Tax=Cucumis melo var. makuwa TaxID=1194695 RepID=A0A5D3D4L9_CUCMM|nr:putative glycosyltransferase [Cucumis melo var. makuwa]TYK18497.1 putative glycosyltransferase [Cucumis melo var. makuwa]
MGQELFSMSRIGTKRVLWLMGLMFAMILAFQYFELPYGFSLSSLLSAGKVSVMEEGSSQSPVGEPKLKTEIVADSPLEEQRDDEFVPEQDHTLKESLELDIDGDGNNSSLSGDLMEHVDEESIYGNLQGHNQSFDGKDKSLGNDSMGIDGTESYVSTLGYNNHSGDNFATSPSVPPTSSSSWIVRDTSNIAMNISRGDNFAASPAVPPISSSSLIMENTSNIASNTSSHDVFVGSNAPNTSDKPDKSVKTEQLHSDSSTSKNKSVSEEKKVPKVPFSGVYTIADMDNLLLESRSKSPLVPSWSSTADQELLQAKLQIENAPVIENDPNLYAPLFRNISLFKRSYELMESTLKVYIYREGERPIFHQGPLQSIYASEGWFMKILESNKKFVTKNPRKAHLFYLPFSSRQLEEVLYVRDSHSHKNLIQHLKNYLDFIAAKYPYWNRTGGADHFLVACHDWAPAETRKYMAKCIRALCNSDVKEGFVFGKDVSLPETFVRIARNPLRDVGGNPSSKRPILAFFAGSMHGYLRSILLEYWEGKDPDMKISGRMPKVKGSKNYLWHMKNSKYCICAKGYEVNSPRVVESMLYECVPVIISDNFVPPLFEVLNWESFAVFVAEKDIPNLKKILLSIPEKRYREMQMRVKKLQPHFLWHAKPQKYDMFHMILHSIWYNRLHQITPKM